MNIFFPSLFFVGHVDFVLPRANVSVPHWPRKGVDGVYFFVCYFYRVFVCVRARACVAMGVMLLYSFAITFLLAYQLLIL